MNVPCCTAADNPIGIRYASLSTKEHVPQCKTDLGLYPLQQQKKPFSGLQENIKQKEGGSEQ
jgi:hypothetical protein